MTNDERMTKPEARNAGAKILHSKIPSSLDIRHWSFPVKPGAACGAEEIDSTI